MHEIDWYIKPHDHDSFRLIWITSWLAKYRDVNDENEYVSELKNVVVGFNEKIPSQSYYVWF